MKLSLMEPAPIAGGKTYVGNEDEDESLAVQLSESIEMNEATWVLQPQESRPSTSLPGADLLFVTWIAFGEYGDGGLKAHNFHKVDMR